MYRSSIDFICPPERTLCVDGVDFTVKPITMRNLPALVRVVEPVIEHMMLLLAEPTTEAAMKFLARHGEAVTEVVALCSGADRSKIDDMTPDRVAALLLLCCEVNTDFFMRAVPALKAQACQLAPQLVRKWSGVQEPATPHTKTTRPASSNSQAQDTGTKTS